MDSGSNFLSILQQKSIKNRCKIATRISMQLGIDFLSILADLGSQEGGQGGSNESVSSIKNRTWEPQGRQTGPGSPKTPPKSP